MKFKLNENTKEQILAFTISGCLIVLFYVLLKNLGGFAGFIKKFLTALIPFIIGFALSFILVPLRRIIEFEWLGGTNLEKRTKRKVAVGITVVIMFLVIILFLVILIPQLAASLTTFGNSLGDYIRAAQNMIEEINITDPALNAYITDMLNSFYDYAMEWITGTQGVVTKLLSYSMSFVRFIFNFLIGVVIAVYFMIDEEKYKRAFKGFIYQTLGQDKGDYIMYVLHLTARMFNRFISGKALDSLVIGVICWIIVWILRIPYAPLIGFVVGVTNMIPVFGPFLGAIPLIFILLIIDPIAALKFAIFILILQQVDGNIIGPKILGDSMGLPTVWIMFAIIVGGALFGILGMFLGVPFFSVIYILVKARLSDRKI